MRKDILQHGYLDIFVVVSKHKQKKKQNFYTIIVSPKIHAKYKH